MFSFAENPPTVNASSRRGVDVDDEEDYSRAYCDGKGCGEAKVRARIVASLPSGRVLSYCFHHGRRFRAALEEQDALIVELSTT